jgi:PIN domain nuclease of toxin-antitoxin system
MFPKILTILSHQASHKMPNYLIDTHILLWHAENDTKISRSTLAELNSPNTTLYVSQATYWEMTIKKSLGKLNLVVSIRDFYLSALQNSFQVLPFDIDHYQILENLPQYHNDPFDRMIIAQAIAEHLVIITQDEKFRLYEELVTILWN